MDQTTNNLSAGQIENCDQAELIRKSFEQKFKTNLPADSKVCHLRKNTCPYCSEYSLFKIEPKTGDKNYKPCSSLGCAFNEVVYKVDD